MKPDTLAKIKATLLYAFMLSLIIIGTSDIFYF